MLKVHNIYNASHKRELYLMCLYSKDSIAKPSHGMEEKRAELHDRQALLFTQRVRYTIAEI
jgi:hypothetical protein